MYFTDIVIVIVNFAAIFFFIATLFELKFQLNYRQFIDKNKQIIDI